jgi:predicted small secreted protein
MMRNVKVLLAVVLAASAIAGCKKGGGGGYIQTAPTPAVAR